MEASRKGKKTIADEADIPKIDSEEYILTKRLPRRLPKRPNDVYVSRKTDFRAQLARCRKLLESGKYDAIYVHGLGAAVDRAVNIALQLKVTSVGCVAPLEVSANTSTIDLIDDFIPVDDEHEPKTRSRRSSAIHIKVSRVGANFVSDSSVTVPQAVSAVAEDSGKSSADARTSEQFESQQQRAVSKSQKQSKKKPPFSKTQSS